MIPDVDPHDAVRLRVIAPAEVRAGASVPITLRVENTSARPVDLYVRGRRIAFDVVVRAGPDTVWRRLDGEIIPAIVQLRVLAPSETLDLRAWWDQHTSSGDQVPPGEYSIQGFLLVDRPAPLESPVELLRIAGS